MISFTCPGCGNHATPPDHFVGQRVRCKLCGESAVIPEATASVKLEIPAIAPEDCEPWYYLFLERYGLLVAVGGGLQFGGVLLWALELSSRESSAAALSYAYPILYSLGLLLASLLVCALILLVIDCARSLRRGPPR